MLRYAVPRDDELLGEVVTFSPRLALFAGVETVLREGVPLPRFTLPEPRLIEPGVRLGVPLFIVVELFPREPP